MYVSLCMSMNSKSGLNYYVQHRSLCCHGNYRPPPLAAPPPAPPPDWSWAPDIIRNRTRGTIYIHCWWKRKEKHNREFEHICTHFEMQHMMVPLQSQWLGAGQLQAIELIGFPKQIIFSFILPCSLIVQPPPLTASYKWLSTGREKSGEMRLKKKTRKEWSKQRGSWTSLSLRLQSPAKITSKPDCEAPI